MNADQFHQRMAALSEPKTKLRPPYWEFWRWQLWQLGQTDDPANFMNWPIVYHNFLFNHWTNVIDEDFELLQGDWQRWEPVVAIPKTGNPQDNYRDTGYSSALIHQASHLARLEKHTELAVAHLNRILEFGGGFGAMALTAYRAGFRGEYVIYDLPEVAIMSQYFLEAEGIPVSYEEPQGRFDLLLCMSSISETKLAFRDNFLSKIKVRYALFFYQEWFKDWDNRSYFHNLDLDMKWQHWQPFISQPEMWYSLANGTYP